MNKDHSQSWVRISHGLNKLVTNLNNNEQDDNEQEASEMQFEDRTHVLLQADQRPKQNHKDVLLPAHPQKLYLLGKELGPILNRKSIRSKIIQCQKKLINLLRHGSLPREDDGAIEFWRIKDNLQDHFVFCHHWSDEKWKSIMARGGNKDRFQYCTDDSGIIIYFRALQGHSGRNLDPSLQDTVLIPDDFFKYIYHVGCAINFTFHHQFGIDTWRSKFD